MPRLKSAATTLVIGISLLVPVSVSSLCPPPLTPTPLAGDYWGVGVTVCGQLLPVGSVLTARDPDGVVCGKTTVTSAGSFLIHVYGDDFLTPGDEGALLGDQIVLALNCGCEIVAPGVWQPLSNSELQTPFGCECCFCPYQADFSSDGFSDAVDLAIEIDIVFFGTLDAQDSSCPTTRGDFDGSGFADSTDLAFLIDYVFFGGSGPSNPCTS